MPRRISSSSPINLRNHFFIQRKRLFLRPKAEHCGHLHAEQGVVCHLDRKDGTFLPVEEVPDLKHPVNSGGEEHRKPWRIIWSFAASRFSTWQDSKHPLLDEQAQVSSTWLPKTWGPRTRSCRCCLRPWGSSWGRRGSFPQSSPYCRGTGI